MYDFLADFTTTYAHAFSCDIYPAVHHEGDPGAGKYAIAGDFGESEDAVRGNCAAFTAQGDNDPRPSWWGDPFHGGSDDNPHCMFIGDPQFRKAGTTLFLSSTRPHGDRS